MKKILQTQTIWGGIWGGGLEGGGLWGGWEGGERGWGGGRVGEELGRGLGLGFGRGGIGAGGAKEEKKKEEALLFRSLGGMEWIEAVVEFAAGGEEGAPEGESDKEVGGIYLSIFLSGIFFFFFFFDMLFKQLIYD